MSDPLLTTEEAAAMLRVSPGTLRNWRSEGRGPRYVQVEHRVRYEAVALRDFLRENTVTPEVTAK